MINNNKKIKIIFLGTPDYAASCLRQLANDNDISVLFTITKPDIQKNRGMKVVEPEVKMVSKELGIECYQPTKLKHDIELIELIKKSKPDFLVVVAYGEILTKEILDIPTKASINGHASLLPKYRGSSPIQATLLNGDKETGVTTMIMSPKLDAGDILEQEKINIKTKETQEQLFERLKNINANLMLHTIKHFDELKPTKQNENDMTICKIIKKEDGNIDLLNETSMDIFNKVYAYDPWPSAYLKTNYGIIKIWDVDFVDEDIVVEINKNIDKVKIICNFFIIFNNNIYLKTKDSYLRVNILQPESKRRMYAKDFINGFK